MASLKHSQSGEKGFFTRWFESIAEARMRQAQNEIQLRQASHAWMRDADEKEEDRSETKH